MKINVFLKTKKGGERYAGKYVALKSFKNTTVVASGKIPEKVMDKAYSNGYKEAVILFIPKKNVPCIYTKLS